MRAGLARIGRRLPRAGWLCLAVALLNGFAWSLITPPFHVPDEISHVAYVQHLAETGNAPRHVVGDYMSEEERRTLESLRFFSVVGQAANRPIWTVGEQQALEDVEDQPLDRVSDGSSSTAVNNPPLFHSLQVAPYKLASGGGMLDRLAAMRLLSVLLSALTVLCVFQFLRELFPRSPWAWATGALAVAFQPLFGFVSTGVNNDSGLFLAAAFLFWMLARTLRRGLTRRRGAAIGLAVGLGAITKLTFVAFAPAAGLALLALAVRGGRPRRGERLAALGVAAAVAAVPLIVYLALNELVWDRQVFGALVGTEAVPFDGRAGSLREEISYIWQLYLPGLPFQADMFAGEALRTVWLNGLIGRFGWLDYGFEPWVYDLGFGVALAVGALAAVGALRALPALRGRWLDVAVYGLAVLGLMLVIGVPGYAARIGSPYPFEQARYLLPLLPLYAGVLVLAARAAGPRWAPTVGGLLVVVAATHGVFAQLITIARYYG
jgi:4-amino-4-deoxy-L-arabinose transferase-like glycosyltransferase